MELSKIFNKKINRNKFFITAGSGFLSYTILRSFPFNLFSGGEKKNFRRNKKVDIKINPNAVSRNKIGEK